MLKQESLDGISKFSFSAGGGETSVSFVPGYGGTITELHFFHQGKNFQVLDGFKTAEQIRMNEKSRGIFLVPFPNRIRDGKYVFKGKEFFLPINKPKENNAIHGFIWNRNFEIEETKNAITLRHEYGGNYPGFPFPFSFSVSYELTGTTNLTITLRAINTGKSSMPFGAGWHPYFTFHQPVDTLQLKLPGGDMLETDERLIPTGIKKQFNQFQDFQTIGKRDFDHAFELSKPQEGYETSLRESVSGATITVQQDANFKYLQVYIPPDRNSIAIEPMTCPANAFNSGEGLIVLEEQEVFESRIKVKIHNG